MRFLLLGFFFFSIAVSAQNKTTHSKARIYIHDKADLSVLLESGVSVDDGVLKINDFVESIFSNTELEKAKNLGFDIDIIIEDAQKYYIENIKYASIDKNAVPCTSSGTIDYETPENFNLGSMGGFLTYSEMISELDEMHTLYPELITLKNQISDFQSIEGRPMYWLKISDNPNIDEDEPEMLYSAVHHAREPGSMQQLIFYMWYLLENYETNSEIQSLLNNTELYFVPMVNPDGYIYNETTNPEGGGMWRKNRRNNGDGTMGVDLNRNYSFHWGESGVSGSDGQTYPGTAGFSEPETQAMKWFCEQHNFVMALNAHTYSQLLLYPYGYDYEQYTPDHALFGAITELMVSQNGYSNILSSDLYPASGDSDDWMYGDTSSHNKILAMTPEVGASFWPSISSIIPTCKGMVFLNLTGAQLIHNFAVVEDTSVFNITDVSGEFDYNIQRLGVASPGDFNVSIIPVSDNIISIGAANIHNGMAQSEIISSSISYTLSAGISDGAIVEYKLVVDNGLFETEKLISKVFGTPNAIFFENGDTTNQWVSSSWGVTSADYFSAYSSITDSPSGDYTGNSNSTIKAVNGIDLTDVSTAFVSFYAKWDIENNYDYVQFEVSMDGGASWQAQCGNYTNAGVAEQYMDGQPLYDGQQMEWVQEIVDLSDYIGSTIKIRFRLYSDSWTEGDGFYFDDLSINTLPENTEAVTDPILEQFIMYPNPTRDVVQFLLPYTLQHYQLRIVNLTGQVMQYNILSNQNKSIDISTLSNGIYFVKITSAIGSRTLKLIVE